MILIGVLGKLRKRSLGNELDLPLQRLLHPVSSRLQNLGILRMTSSRPEVDRALTLIVQKGLAYVSIRRGEAYFHLTYEGRQYIKTVAFHLKKSHHWFNAYCIQCHQGFRTFRNNFFRLSSIERHYRLDRHQHHRPYGTKARVGKWCTCPVGMRLWP